MVATLWFWMFTSGEQEITSHNVLAAVRWPDVTGSHHVMAVLWRRDVLCHCGARRVIIHALDHIKGRQGWHTAPFFSSASQRRSLQLPRALYQMVLLGLGGVSMSHTAQSKCWFPSFLRCNVVLVGALLGEMGDFSHSKNINIFIHIFWSAICGIRLHPDVH